MSVRTTSGELAAMWRAVAVSVQSSIVKIRSLKASRMQRSRGTARSTVHRVLSPSGVAFLASSRRSRMAASLLSFGIVYLLFFANDTMCLVDLTQNKPADFCQFVFKVIAAFCYSLKVQMMARNIVYPILWLLFRGYQRKPFTLGFRQRDSYFYIHYYAARATMPATPCAVASRSAAVRPSSSFSPRAMPFIVRPTSPVPFLSTSRASALLCAAIHSLSPAR